MSCRPLLSTLLIVPAVVSAATEAEDLPPEHSKFTTVVTKKAGALVVTTPNGATHQLNENMALRHGQEPFKTLYRKLWLRAERDAYRERTSGLAFFEI